MLFQLYGLLHLAENEKSAMNFFAQSFIEQIEIYLKDAITLSNSLKIRGIKFAILTNKKDKLDQLLERIGCRGSLEVQEISFNMKIPSGVNFFSAHYKVETYQYFASLNPDSYIGLIDLDIIAINDFPRCLNHIIRDKIPLCYDVSDQMISAFGHERLLSDIQKIFPNVCEGRWYGGEFITGTPDFFRSLNKNIQEILDDYIRYASSLYHQSDEVLLSVAVEKMRQDGFTIADAGTLGIVGRYWSCPPLHPQKPFEYFKSCFLLHLPTDKCFLAELDEVTASDRDSFLKEYTLYHQQKQRILKRQKIISKLRKFINYGRTF